ncbi:MAG: hypothetical protein K0Q72_2958 [Armatimonadetes bacterium]|nr:hypothetical protein [Armatimonadota bacterium]
MKLGFVSAILPELSLEEVAAFAAEAGYDCVEVMCWPRGGAERRYAGVTHLDVTEFGPAEAARVRELMAATGVEISGLGYYPNALSADPAESEIAVRQIERVIRAASLLGPGLGRSLLLSFEGRDAMQSIVDYWPRVLEVWLPLIRLAEEHGVRIGIENCPMLFTRDEWPGGKNLAISPAVWRRMFTEIPSPSFGLNYDPSHLVWQGMDEVQPIREFGDRISHVHAKDVRVHRETAPTRAPWKTESAR